MTTPMNASLYERLQARFGDVRITNASEPRQVRYVPDPVRPGKFKVSKHHPTSSSRGEQYNLSCPFCGDTRRRFYMSYQYGEFDHKTGSRNSHLWNCFNEDCHKDRQNRKTLQNMLDVRLGPRRRQHPPTGSPTTPTPSPAPPPPPPSLPEGLTLVNKLLPSHPAAKYLLERHFDLDELATTRGVAYCDWALPTHYPCPTHRLVIPIYQPPDQASTTDSTQDKLVLGGCQARSIPGLDPLGVPDAKYIFARGTQKSQLLYGLPAALKTTGPVFVVEGPTDVWRTGANAVAIFGKTLSDRQRFLLAYYFAGRPIVVLMDADALEAAGRIQRELRIAVASHANTPIVAATLPPGRNDPAECSREEIEQAGAVALAQYAPQTMRGTS